MFLRDVCDMSNVFKNVVKFLNEIDSNMKID